MAERSNETAIQKALLGTELLDHESVRALLGGLSRPRFDQGIRQDPTFPTPLRLGGPRSHPRWRADEVVAWLEAQRERRTYSSDR